MAIYRGMYFGGNSNWGMSFGGNGYCGKWFYIYTVGKIQLVMEPPQMDAMVVNFNKTQFTKKQSRLSKLARLATIIKSCIKYQHLSFKQRSNKTPNWIILKIYSS